MDDTIVDVPKNDAKHSFLVILWSQTASGSNSCEQKYFLMEATLFLYAFNQKIKIFLVTFTIFINSDWLS